MLRFSETLRKSEADQFNAKLIVIAGKGEELVRQGNSAVADNMNSLKQLYEGKIARL